MAPGRRSFAEEEIERHDRIGDVDGLVVVRVSGVYAGQRAGAAKTEQAGDRVADLDPEVVIGVAANELARLVQPL